MNSKFAKFALSAALGLALSFIFSCSSGGGGSFSHGDDDDLVNAKNEAWVACKGDECSGVIFKQNGELIFIYSENDGNWNVGDYISTYSVKGNKITICLDDDCSVDSYKISGNTLTITEGGSRYTFTRTSGVYVGGSGGGSSSPVGGVSSSSRGGGVSSPGGKSSSGSVNGSSLVNCYYYYEGDMYCTDKSEDYAFTYDECLAFDGTVVSSCKNVEILSSSSGGGGGNIVNVDYEAWIECNDYYCSGFMFRQTGELISISREYGSSAWSLDVINSYSINGSQITVCSYSGYQCEVVSYSISGNTLTIKLRDGRSVNYTRMSGVHVYGY